MTGAGPYYKAVKLDGTDFRTGQVQWAPPDGHDGEWIVRHPTAKRRGRTAASYLSVATTPTACTGMRIELFTGKVYLPRLLLVEYAGRGKPGTDDGYPNKRTGLAFRYVDELDSMLTLGPQAKQIVALAERTAAPLSWTAARRIIAARENTREAALEAARDATWEAALEAARDATWGTTRRAAWETTWGTTWEATLETARGTTWEATLEAAREATREAALTVLWDTVQALVVRDLLAQEHYDTLTRTWREAIGPIHPDDSEL